MKYLLLFSLVVSTCLQAQNAKLVIQGECQACLDQKVYISHMAKDGEYRDTVNLISRKFFFEKRIENEEWIQIRFQHKKGRLDLITLPGQQIEIILKGEDNISYSIIKGSPESVDRMNYFLNHRKLGVIKKNLEDSIASYEENSILAPTSFLNKLDSINASIEAMVFETILTTKSILLKDLSLMWIKSPVYIGKIQIHIDSLSAFHSDNHDFKNLKESYQYYLGNKINLEKIDIEKFFMNFSIQSLNGTYITPKNISSKYLFVEFWASWCKPCRISNQKINQNREIFQHDKLFTFFISLDKDPLKWKDAIAADKLQWANHGIDAYDPEKSFAKSIGVSLIPTNLLIAPNGQIILQNATPEDVKAFLEKLK